MLHQTAVLGFEPKVDLTVQLLSNKQTTTNNGRNGIEAGQSQKYLCVLANEVLCINTVHSVLDIALWEYLSRYQKRV